MNWNSLKTSNEKQQISFVEENVSDIGTLFAVNCLGRKRE
jgi:hypothetical protein